MPLQRIPLVGSFASRDGTNTSLFGGVQKDQYFEDCAFHVVRNPLTQNTTVKVGPRELFTKLFENPAGVTGNGTCCVIWRGAGIGIQATAFGNTNSSICVSSVSVGTITGLAVHMAETLLSNTATLLIISASNRAYYYQNAGVVTEIIDTDFPPKQGTPLTITGNFAVLDGFHFIMCTNGQIWHSDVNSITAWTSTASITAQEYPDRGVSVARYRNFVVALSQYSIEFFYNAGNAAGAVLRRVQNMARQVGLVNEHCLVETMDSIAWIGHDRHVYGVYMLDGGAPVKISNEFIDNLLFHTERTNNDGGASFRLHILSSHGRSYLAVALAVNTSNVMVYDFETRIWQPWTLEFAIRKSDSVGGSALYVGHTFVGGAYNGGDGFASAVIQTVSLDFGTQDRKTQRRLRIIGDRAPTSPTNIAVSWSDDGYQTSSTARDVDMSKADTALHKGGVFRSRSYKLTGLSTNATNREQLIEALEIDYEVMA